MSTIKPLTEESKYLRYYHEIFENSVDVIYLVEITEDHRFIHLDINTAFSEAVGLPKESIVGGYVDEIENREFRDILIEKYSLCLNSGVKTDYIGNYNFPMGKKTYHSTLSPIRDESGRIHRIVGIARDITEQQINEKQLEETKVQLASLISTIPDIIWMKDINGVYLTCNLAFETFFNASKDAIIGKTDYDFFNPDEADICKQSDLEAITSNTLSISQETFIYPDTGANGIWEIRKNPVFKPDGELLGVLGIARDITERKKMEYEISQQKDFQNTLLLSIAEAGLGVHVIDDGKYIYTNDIQKAKKYGYDETIFDLKPNFLETIHPDDRAKALDMYTRRLRGEDVPSTYELGVVQTDGTRKDHTVSVIVIPNTDPIQTIVVTQDISERKVMEGELKASEEKYRTLIENSTDYIIRYDKYARILYLNPHLELILGTKLANIIGKTPTESLPRELYEEYEVVLKRVIESGNNDSYNLTLPDMQGGYIYHQLDIIAEHDDKANIIGAITIGHDITDSKKYEIQLKQNEQRLKEAQKIAKVGSWELVFPSLNLRWSDEIYRIFEITPNNEAPNYADFIDVIHPEDRDIVDSAYQQSLNNKIPYEITHRLRMKDGRIKYVHEKGETLYDTQGNPLRSIGTAQDVTEQKMVEKKIEYMAHHDALTGLPNRILSKERTEQAIANAKLKNSKMAFLFIDLDGFKNINDSMGHSAGDTMLKIVAERLREIIKVSDTISRQGGDEFLITLSDVNDRNDIISIADRLLRELEQSFYINEQMLSTSASIGIAVYPENGDTFESLLQNADSAMYAAKASGKNAYSFYTKQMSNNLIKQFKIQNDLKSALANNEFILHYQPQIDLAQNQITGAEALIRWNHPQLKMIPPLSFIPIAESSGMIVPIGEWVIMEACRQCALWHTLGLEITIAVNISAVQFKRGNLEAIIKNALALSGLPPQFLELELTESILIHDSENILLAVHALKALGIKLSIDDFGTGYSSLSYLKRFAVDKLKIDQSFVKDILRDQEDAAIVQTIIQMAKNLNLKTIAEGVENKKVLTVIESYGCDEVQGYHFAKPMEAGEFEKYHGDFVNERNACQS